MVKFSKILMVFGVVLAMAGCAYGAEKNSDVVDHPSLLPPLTKDSVFPRCSNEELQAAGFPDHMHVWKYSTWVTPVDENGLAYGPGAFCNIKKVIPRDDVIITDDVKEFGPFRMSHNPGYSHCDMLAFMELLDYAWHFVPDLLGLTTDGKLNILNPDNSAQYLELTGHGIWRLYFLTKTECILQPYAVLRGRTLDGHAAFMLVTDWLLMENLGQTLPPWMHQGLVEYIGEDGVHLVNYMAQFRPNGPVLFSPPLTDAILSGGLDNNQDRDREMFRRACYSAFLMVHQLVEHEGGMEAMREFLALAAAGTDLDEAARKVWNRNMQELAASLDPAQVDEPIGSAIQPRSPHRQPLISN